MRRITILIGAMAALMLVPAAQAFAETGHVKVNIVGTGSGEVKSEEEPGVGVGPGTPQIECSYNGASQSGECENTPDLFEEEPGFYAAWLEPFPAEGSEFVRWTVTHGEDIGECEPGSLIEPACLISNALLGEENVDVEWEVTAEFVSSGPPPPVGPPLNLSIEEGEGTVVSNPAGIECTGNSGSAGPSCSTEEIEEGTVTLTASPAAGYAFKSWKGCDKKSGIYGVNGRQCTINLTEERSVSAKFVKVWNLTLENGGGGKVSSKPGGALCLPNCSETTASFAEGKTVEVLSKPNKHFHLVGFGGDCSGTSCTLPSISADHTVSASFAEDTKYALALAKEGGGQALIKTKGPGSVCSYTCSTSTASFYEGETVLVSWKLGKGTSSLTWSTGAGTCTGTHEGAEGSCEVTMSSAKSLVAELE